MEVVLGLGHEEQLGLGAGKLGDHLRAPAPAWATCSWGPPWVAAGSP
ncbi:hypothetical protein [Nonomuraea sp. B19D2]